MTARVQTGYATRWTHRSPGFARGHSWTRSGLRAISGDGCGALSRHLGGGSYLNELLVIAGGRNLYADLAEPAPQVSLEDVMRRDPDAILTTTQGELALRADPRWRAWLSLARHRSSFPIQRSSACRRYGWARRLSNSPDSFIPMRPANASR